MSAESVDFLPLQPLPDDVLTAPGGNCWRGEAVAKKRGAAEGSLYKGVRGVGVFIPSTIEYRRMTQVRFCKVTSREPHVPFVILRHHRSPYRPPVLRNPVCAHTLNRAYEPAVSKGGLSGLLWECHTL